MKKDRAVSRSLVVAALLSLIVVLSGCGAAAIKHANVVDPVYPPMASSDLKALGQVTSIASLNGNLYIAGQDGIAAMDGSGKTLWTLALPSAAIRLLDVDADNVVFTAYSPSETNKDSSVWTIANAFSVDNFKDCRIGLVSATGELVWSVDSTEESSKLSAPTLAKNTIGVTRNKTFLLLDRKTGKEISTVEVGGSGIEKSATSKSPNPKPVLANGAFYLAHYKNLVKVDAESGKELESHTMYGLFSQFGQITAGPVKFQDIFVFGNFGTQDPAKVFAANADLKEEWIEKIKDKYEPFGAKPTYVGVAAIAANHDRVFVATNFHLVAFDKKGSNLWERQNKGGLYPGHFRGLLYGKTLVPHLNDFGALFSGSGIWATQSYPGTQMVATDSRVYITSKYNDNDALTVLDAKTGDYIKSINMKTNILDMTAMGDKLALATTDGLKFVDMK